MGYYIRVLGLDERQPTIDHLQRALSGSKSSTTLEVETETEGEWQQLILTHQNGPEIAIVERNRVIAGELGKEELDEFIEEVQRHRPVSAAQWLQTYLPNIQVIYAFQLLSGTKTEAGLSAVHVLQTAIWSAVGGILQSDREGFSNEDGYHILWQFPDTAVGKWNMAVLAGGAWIAFEMELGNAQQRDAFLRGEVPPGVRLV